MARMDHVNRRNLTSYCAVFCVVGMAAALAGCARRQEFTPRPGVTTAAADVEIDRLAEQVRQDPTAYLHTVAERCRGLQQYTLKFTRYERRGLLRTLQGPEHINAWFRRDPFSVRLKWDNEDLKYYESAYVAGEYRDKVRFLTRWWTPPLLPRPGINVVDLQTPVFWGESLRPLTDFGLERLMQRTLDSLAELGSDAAVEYRGLVQMPGTSRPVHHIRLSCPPALKRVPIQELYIDVHMGLPVGTELKYPDDSLHAAYYYEDVNSAVELTDDDFLLEPEREKLAKDEPDGTM